MSLQRAITATGLLILGTLIGAVLIRKRYLSCYTFLAYLIAVLASDALIFCWPDRFLTWDFWLMKETIHNLLKFAVALELGIRTFRLFPGANATARRLLLLILALTYVAVVAVPTGDGNYAVLAAQIQPRILNGTIWVFTSQAALILWYRLPVDSFHKAILIGFIPYLLIFSVAMNTLNALGWRQEVNALQSYTQTSAYDLVLLYWLRAALQPIRVV
jgi:hypothetical protein